MVYCREIQGDVWLPDVIEGCPECEFYEICRDENYDEFKENEMDKMDKMDMTFDYLLEVVDKLRSDGFEVESSDRCLKEFNTYLVDDKNGYSVTIKLTKVEDQNE